MSLYRKVVIRKYYRPIDPYTSAYKPKLNFETTSKHKVVFLKNVNYISRINL